MSTVVVWQLTETERRVTVIDGCLAGTFLVGLLLNAGCGLVVGRSTKPAN